jgi:16S rRNA (guanine527-N7)-methyltransferase
VKRLEQLAGRFSLETDVVGRLEILLSQLAREEAPTSVHEPRRAVDVHVADSLVALEVPEIREAGSVADLGSGAGLPALVLAAALPWTRVAAVESNARKCAFITEAAEAMGLSNVEVVRARAEEWSEGLGEWDAVTARAVSALPVLCEYAAPLLREGGTLVAWKGSVDEDELRDGEAAAARLGLAPSGVVPVEPYRDSERRTLYLFEKVAPTPPNFPRRSGMAAKKPLRANPKPRVETSEDAE